MRSLVCPKKTLAFSVASSLIVGTVSKPRLVPVEPAVNQDLSWPHSHTQNPARSTSWSSSAPLVLPCKAWTNPSSLEVCDLSAVSVDEAKAQLPLTLVSPKRRPANVFYPDQFNLPEGSTRDWYVGLIAGAPYLCRSVCLRR